MAASWSPSMIKTTSGDWVDLAGFVEIWSDRFGLGHVFNSPADNAIYRSPAGTYILKRLCSRQTVGPMHESWTEYSWETPMDLCNFLAPRSGGRRAIRRLFPSGEAQSEAPIKPMWTGETGSQTVRVRPRHSAGALVWILLLIGVFFLVLSVGVFVGHSRSGVKPVPESVGVTYVFIGSAFVAAALIRRWLRRR